MIVKIMFICDQQQTPHWAFVFLFLSASGKSRRKKINATFSLLAPYRLLQLAYVF